MPRFTRRSLRLLVLVPVLLATSACGVYTRTVGDELRVDELPFSHLDATVPVADLVAWLDNGFLGGDVSTVLERCARPISLRPGGSRSEPVEIDRCASGSLTRPQSAIAGAIAQTLPSVTVSTIPGTIPVSIDTTVDLGGPVCDLQVTADIAIDPEFVLEPDRGEWRDFPGGPGIVLQGRFGSVFGSVRNIDADAQCGSLIVNGQLVGLLEGIPDGALDVRLLGGVEARTLLQVAPGFQSLAARKRVVRRVAASGGTDWELDLSMTPGVLPQPHGDDWFRFLEPDLARELVDDVIAALDPRLTVSFGEVHDAALTGVNAIVTKGSHDGICGIGLHTKPITVDGLPGLVFDSLFFRASRGALLPGPGGQTICLAQWLPLP